MMDVLSVAGLRGLMAATEGSPAVAVGMIDGPVDLSHPDLQGTPAEGVGTGQAACREAASEACHHGTFVAGILSARRGGPAPAICPGCTLLVRSIFCEAPLVSACPAVTPAELARAVAESVDAGARILNLSVGLSTTGLGSSPELRDAFDYAVQRGALIVAAAGNHGTVGPVPLLQHPAVLPVAACDLNGRLAGGSNVGVAVGRQGLLAPGSGVLSTAAGGGYTSMSGTSVAAPFVSGAAALLWSLHPGADAAQVRAALLRPGVRRTTVVPPLMNASESRAALAAAQTSTRRAHG
jgi:subtilisin family serine protease